MISWLWFPYAILPIGVYLRTPNSIRTLHKSHVKSGSQSCHGRESKTI